MGVVAVAPRIVSSTAWAKESLAPILPWVCGWQTWLTWLQLQIALRSRVAKEVGKGAKNRGSIGKTPQPWQVVIQWRHTASCLTTAGTMRRPLQESTRPRIRHPTGRSNKSPAASSRENRLDVLRIQSLYEGCGCVCENSGHRQNHFMERERERERKRERERERWLTCLFFPLFQGARRLNDSQGSVGSLGCKQGAWSALGFGQCLGVLLEIILLKSTG